MKKNNLKGEQHNVWSLFGDSLPPEWNKPINESKESDCVGKNKNKKRGTTSGTSNPKLNAIPKTKEVIYVKLPTTVWIGTTPIPLSSSNFDDDDFRIPTKEANSIENKNEGDNINITNETEKNMESTESNHDSQTVVQESFDPNCKYVDLETIREFIEEKLPAYTKERTKMYYDKDKNIVIPDLYNSKLGGLSPFSGYFFSIEEALKSNLPINVCACQNGYFNVINTSYGFMSVQTKVKELAIGSEGFVWTLPSKIPCDILIKLANFFKYVARLDETYEAMGRIYYDSTKRDFFIIIPEQETSFCSCKLLNSYEHSLPPSVTRVMTCHSHPVYPAKFSSIDNDNDKETGLYMVMGWTATKEIPDFKIRMSANGTFRDINLSSIFDMPSTINSQKFTHTLFPNEWIKKITFLRSKRGTDI